MTSDAEQLLYWEPWIVACCPAHNHAAVALLQSGSSSGSAASYDAARAARMGTFGLLFYGEGGQ